MRNEIGKVLSEMGIEYFAVLDYRDLRETSPEIAARAELAPRSAILYLAPYYTGPADNISCYAASLDYHALLRETGDRIVALLEEHFPDCKARSYGDHSPINEIHAALVGGLGVIGDNGLIINERYGSYVFVGDVLSDIPPELLGASAPLPVRSCEHCGACKTACPTGILRGEGDDCLSAVTQRKGELTPAEEDMMRKHSTAWGCDLCQRVCPHNVRAEETPIDFFRRDRIQRLTRELVDGMSKDEFARRAFAWRGRKTVLRNLAVLGDE